MPQRRKVSELHPDSLVALEADWRAGLLPARTVAVKFGVDVVELRAYALSSGWEQGDLRHAIDQSALQAGVERAVSDHERARSLPNNAPVVMNPAETVRVYGQIVAGVNEEQRDEIRRARRHAGRLLRELEDLAGPEIDRAALEGVAKLISADDPKLAKLLTEIPEPTEFGGRLSTLDKKASVLVKLANAMRELVTMERVAWGLDKPGGGSAGYDELLEELLQHRNGRTA